MGRSLHLPDVFGCLSFSKWHASLHFRSPPFLHAGLVCFGGSFLQERVQFFETQVDKYGRVNSVGDDRSMALWGHFDIHWRAFGQVGSLK